MTFRARYGASPVHLLAHLALLPLVAWALLTVLDFRAASNVVLWLVGAVILHDLVLLPAYSALDRVARVAVPGAINYVRVPGGLSLLSLLVFWGTIRGKGAGTYARVSGQEFEGYVSRWLLLTGTPVRDLGRALPAPDAQALILGLARDDHLVAHDGHLARVADRRERLPQHRAAAGGVVHELVGARDRHPQAPALLVEGDRIRSADLMDAADQLEARAQVEDEQRVALDVGHPQELHAVGGQPGRPDPGPGLPSALERARVVDLERPLAPGSTAIFLPRSSIATAIGSRPVATERPSKLSRSRARSISGSVPSAA